MLIAMETPGLKRTKDFNPPSGVLSASVCPSTKSIALGCLHGVFLLDVESGEQKLLHEHGSYVSTVVWTSDHTIVSAGYDGFVCWYDVETSEVTRRLKLHDFWSWDMALSPDRSRLASVTGQYLAGGYRYEPSPENEPSLRVLSVETGDVLQSLPHVPSVQSVAISPDNQFVAAGNLMGEVRVFDMDSGEMVAQWTTPDFTSWGIIKSHSYLGGIFSIRFTPQGDELLLAGMGPMRDPMAGNGRQLWQKWRWRSEKPSRVDQTHEGESGEGLMEALAVHPDSPHFVMGGRLRGGDWNAAMFDLQSGKRVALLKTGYRVTEAQFFPDCTTLLLAGLKSQSVKKTGEWAPFGRVELYQVTNATNG